MATQWKRITATPDEIRFAELVAAGTSATQAIKQVLPQRAERLADQSLRRLASTWLGKPQVTSAIMQIRDAALCDALDHAVSSSQMIQEGFALAKQSADHRSMIAAGVALAEITGYTHANRRHIDLQYNAALRDADQSDKPDQPGIRIELADHTDKD